MVYQIPIIIILIFFSVSMILSMFLFLSADFYEYEMKRKHKVIVTDEHYEQMSFTMKITLLNAYYAFQVLSSKIQ